MGVVPGNRDIKPAGFKVIVLVAEVPCINKLPATVNAPVWVIVNAEVSPAQLRFRFPKV